MSILNFIGGRSGLNSYSCSRSFSTMGVKNMKSEYLSNDNYNFLDAFGVPHEIKNDKQFVEVNGLSKHSKNDEKNSSCKSCGHADVINLKNRQNTSMERPKETCQEIFIITDIPQLSEMKENDTKTSPLAQPNKCDCSNQSKKTKKKSRKKNKQSKKSKCKLDRNVSYPSSKVKRKNKNWHKKSLKMEIIEMDVSGLDYAMESPYLNEMSVSELCLITSPLENNNKKSNVATMQSLKKECVSNNSESERDTSEDSFVVCEEADLSDARSEDQVDFCISIAQNKFRPRLSSDCGSEDSFILFQDNSPLKHDKNSSDICLSIKTKPNFRSRLPPSECESEDSFIVFENCKYDSDGEVDEDSYYATSTEEESDDEGILFCSNSLRRQSSVIERHKAKKVRFAEDGKLCTVHPMVKWSFAYRKARKSPWEQMALDRSRFENRVNRLKVILDPILRASHRNEIYKERFLDECK